MLIAQEIARLGSIFILHIPKFMKKSYKISHKFKPLYYLRGNLHG